METGLCFRAPLLPSKVAGKLVLFSVSPDMESGDWQCFVPALIQLGHGRELSGRGSELICGLGNQAAHTKWGWGVRDQGQALPAMLPGHFSSVMVPPGLVSLRPCSHPSPTKGSCCCRSRVTGGAEGVQSNHFPENEMSPPRCLSLYLSEQGLAMASSTEFGAGKGMNTAFWGLVSFLPLMCCGMKWCGTGSACQWYGWGMRFKAALVCLLSWESDQHQWNRWQSLLSRWECLCLAEIWDHPLF